MHYLRPTVGRFAALATIATSVLVLSACEAVFEHNVAGDPVAPGPFLGSWAVVEVLGAAPPSPTTVQVEADVDGGLIINVTDSSGTTEASATLTALAGATILSIKNRNDSWQISRISLTDGGQRLVVQLPQFGPLRDDVLAGVIAGEVRQVDLDTDDLVIVSEDTAELSRYVAANLDIFQETVAVLKRNEIETSP